MLEWILLAVGLAGFGLAGCLDLKTTEFPDWIPYAMIVSALFVRGAFAWLLQDWSIITESVIVGILFLAFGLALYILKQWGDGDAWLLGALGFLFPNPSGFSVPAQIYFPAVMLFNFFLTAFVYLVAYSIIIGIRMPGIPGKFLKELKRDSKGMAYVIAAFCLAYAFLMALVYFVYSSIPFPPINALILPVMLLALLVFVRYGRFIESSAFKRRIDVSRLRAGDVPAGEKWRVLTKEEVRKLKRRGGKIWIKEGVRFAPVFLITMLVTLLFGNLMGFLI